MQGDEMFAQFLLDAGVLPRSVVSHALTRTDDEKTLSDVLVEEGILSEEDTTHALAKALSMPVVLLGHDDINSEALFTIPEAFSRTHGLVAYKKEFQRLFVAVTTSASIEKLETLNLPYQVHVHLTDRQSFKRALLRYQRELAERHAKQMSAEAPGEVVVDSLLLHALAQGARAIHLAPNGTALEVRYRIGGRLHSAMHLPQHVSAGMFGRVAQLAKRGRFAIEHQGNRVMVRVAQGATMHGDTLTLHFSGVSLESLGFHGEGLETLHRAVSQHSGLVLVGGSGLPLSELCAALGQEAAHMTRSVMTVTPTETVSMATRLRGMLRADPDVVVIPQLDTETALLAAHAANRGVLVIAGLEATSAGGALSSLREYVPPTILSAVLLSVAAIGQVRKLCRVHERARLAREEVDELEARGANLTGVLAVLKAEGHLPPTAQWKDVPFFSPSACPECTDGFSDMVTLTEVLPRSMVLAEMLRREDPAEDIEAYMRSEGIFSLLEDGVYKAALGQTTVEEVLQTLL